MSYPASRSCNDELNQGSIDGTYQQVNMNRGGVVEPTTWEARKDLYPTWYGINEVVDKVMPDGVGPVSTPTARAVSHPNYEG